MHTQVDSQQSEEVVVSELCAEPEGNFIRSVRPMQLTQDNMRTFWEKARQFPTIFTQEVNNDFKKFCELFLSVTDSGKFRSHGLFWVIDDFVGVYYMTHITDIDAQVHYTFFDRRHKGREQLTRSMLKHVFDTYGFRRLTTEVPMYVQPHTFGFVYALGFKKEGRKRKCVFFKDDWFDATIFGILRSEL
jgi:RimJ/RimL family protein N-acetyltransferase